jgi:1-deoxy-D-xylulose-5-phosphate reductoisomerase
VNLYLLGSTGSIGRQTLDIVRSSDGAFKVVTLTAHTNIEGLKEQIQEFQPAYVAVANDADAATLQDAYPHILFGSGPEGLIQAATYGVEGEGLVVNAIVGSAGLSPTIAAIEHQRNVALANKETLVVGGELITPLLERNCVRLIPIDSEHSALFQLLEGVDKARVDRLWITASGGSFRDLDRSELTGVTVEDALRHPNWSMGAKITVDSATMVNKGLEVIEAHHLFGVSYDKIEAVLHPESIVHALVALDDQSMLAHLGLPDMRVPISYALHYPKRAPYQGTPLDLPALGALHFEPLSDERFPLFALAKMVGRQGGYAPTVYNAANEAAVALFLDGRISFLQIEDIVLQCSKLFDIQEPLTLNGILAVDRLVKDHVRKAYGKGRD